MRAVQFHEYGDPGRLAIAEVPTPEPTADRVLVRVVAASVNSWDWDRLTGRPRWGRIGGGWRSPKISSFGGDFAGIVTEVGPEVTDFEVGDEVMGDLSWYGFGAFAEYVAPRQELLAAKSPRLTFEEAAAIPQAGLLALQAIKMADPVAGESVLVNGAGGGTGTFAIQLLTNRGASVIGVDRGLKEGVVRSLGAEFIDFDNVDYTKLGRRFDVVLDNVARHTILTYKRVLAPSGRFVAVGGSLRTILQIVALGKLVAGKRQSIRLLTHRSNRADMEEINRMVEAGSVRPVIDRIYPLDQSAEALRHVGELRASGKIVVRV